MKHLTISGALVLSTIGWAAVAQFPSPPTIPGRTITESMGQRRISTEELRTTTSLMHNWKFIQDDNLTDREALASSATNWENIELPHTWNAEAASTGETPPYKRGLGWYRLEFDTPPEGARNWLEFG